MTTIIEITAILIVDNNKGAQFLMDKSSDLRRKKAALNLNGQEVLAETRKKLGLNFNE